MELKTGTVVNLVPSGQVKIVKELGRGGQGIVYLVTLNGKQMALKWYSASLCPDYKQLQRIVEADAPSDAFLWPLFLTKKEYGSYGYVMDLRPQGYYDVSTFLSNKGVKFKSFEAILASSMKICDGFMMLHRLGYSYHDINDGNFFIRPEDGDVLICDNDNVTPDCEKTIIGGKSRYMAPEVVLGNMPNKYSDRFSLSLILFRLFFLDHPLEGAQVLACPCLTEEHERRLYGSEAMFIYDFSKKNLPVAGIHTNIIRRWPIVPSLLRRIFTEQFDQNHLTHPQTRLIEQEWKKVIERVRDQLVICPYCHKESFIDLEKGTYTCMECSREIDASHRLIIGNRTIILTVGTKLYLNDDNIPEAEVVKFSQEPNRFELGLKNLMNASWMVTTASGRLVELPPHQSMPVRNGMIISFPSIIEGKGKIEVE